jgi:integrase
MGDVLRSGTPHWTHRPTGLSAVVCCPALQPMLSAAVDDEVISANPAAGLHRRFRILARRRDVSERIRALTADEIRRFLRTAWRLYPHLAPLYEVGARAGLRPGEIRALQWQDVRRSEIRVERGLTDGHLLTPKSGVTRLVEIGPQLGALLARLPHEGAWCFPNPRTGKPWHAVHLYRVCRAIGEAIGLEGLHPHVLRHTYASLLVAAGEPLQWIARQLGHSRTAITEVTYGSWLRMTNPKGLVGLDALIDGGLPAGVRLLPGGRHQAAGRKGSAGAGLTGTGKGGA